MISLFNEISDLKSPSSMMKVDAFLKIIERAPDCLIISVYGRLFRNGTIFGVGPKKSFNITRLTDIDRNNIIKACVSHGHLSLWFNLTNMDFLIEEFISLEFYKKEGEIDWGGKYIIELLDENSRQSIEDFIASPLAQNIDTLVTFSHDASYFYVWKK